MNEKIAAVLLIIAFVPAFFAFGVLVWGASLLEESFERQDKLRAEMWEYEHVIKPQTDAMFEGAEQAGFTNSDLIWNSTSLCWYKSESNSFYGDCEEHKIRLAKINAESVNYSKLTWASLNDKGERSSTEAKS